MRRIKPFILLVFIVFTLKANAQQIEEQLFYLGKLVRITVDKQLYISEETDFFYIHVNIYNTSKNVLGIDLTNKSYVIYPNQWMFSDTTYRSVIDEILIKPDELTAEKLKELSKKISENKLHMLLPGQKFDYYTEFNARKPSDDELLRNKYLIVALDGQMFFTDGKNCEQVKCNGDLNVDREVAIPCPFEWKTIPQKEKIHHR